MGKLRADLLALNRGIVSPLALARIDVARVRLSAEVMTNWTAKTQGAMMLRAGMEYLGNTEGDSECVLVPFVAATDDTALLEMTVGQFRVRLADGLLTRPAVTTTINNGTFASATGWTQAHAGGATASFGGSGLTLLAKNRGGMAIVRQLVAVAGGNIGIEHALRITVTRGPVTFRCGSTVGGTEYIAETSLGTGTHSLAFTPTGGFYVQFQSSADVNRIVASVAVEAAGVVTVPTPYLVDDLPYIRWDQSADVLFVAGNGRVWPRRIERRSPRSWSIAIYQPNDGPFTPLPTSPGVRLKPGAVTGNTTLTASQPFFQPGHVGTLFRLFHERQNIDTWLGAENTFSDPVRITGAEPMADRVFTVNVTGTWSGRLTLQRSFDGPDEGYNNITISSGYKEGGIYGGNYVWTSNGNIAYRDEAYNQVAWVRVGFLPSQYTSGAARVRITYGGGGDYGICRVVGYTSPTQVSIEILRPFKLDQYTDSWREGLWSGVRGWPTSVALHEGRLGWSGRGRFWLSISDAFDSFDAEHEGDAGPLDRSVGRGPVDNIHWMVPAQRLLLGTTGSEISVRSSSFDEMLSPTNANAKACSTKGSARVPAVLSGSRVVFVQRSGKRVYELAYNVEANDYAPRDLTLLSPDIASADIVWLAMQEEPDPRIHCVMADGKVAVLTYSPEEEVMCWAIVETDGAIENIAVLPGAEEDEVYYVVRREIDGQTRRFVERLAKERECVGGALNKQADAFVVVENVTGDLVTGLGHLEGKTVVAWGGGKDLGTYTVQDGEITLTEELDGADVMVGLGYSAPWKSTKLAYGAQMGTALTQPKKVNYLGLIAQNMHNRGLKYGPSFDELDDLPRMHDEAEVGEHHVYGAFDEPMFELDGEFDTDSRLCLMAQAPRPVTLLACVLGMETNEK